MRESLIATKSYAFALAILHLSEKLSKTTANIVLIKQIIRSATSIGANIEEAGGASSRRDFIHCMNISKKEARETRYWLKLLRDTNTNFESELEVLLNESEQIINILTRIVKTSIANQNKKSLTL